MVEPVFEVSNNFLRHSKIQEFLLPLHKKPKLILCQNQYVVMLIRQDEGVVMSIHSNTGPVGLRGYWSYRSESEEELIAYAEERFGIPLAKRYTKNRMRWLLGKHG